LLLEIHVPSVTLERVEENLAYFTVEMDKDDVEKAFKDVFRYYSRNLKIPGFRKGKVPAKIIENRLGKATILDVVTGDIKETAHKLAFKESELTPRRGDVRWDSVGAIERGAGVTLAFAAPVMPEVSLPEIDGVEIVFTPQLPDEKMKEQMVESLRKKYAAYEELGADETTSSGQRVEISLSSTFVETGEKSPFENKKVVYELGLSENLPGFDENLLGLKLGEKKSFEYEMPEDFVDERIAGKQLAVEATVAKAEKMVLPEINLEFIKENFNLDSEEAFHEYLDNVLKYEVEAANLKRKKELALEQMLAGAEVEITKDMIDPQLDAMVENEEMRLRKAGTSLDELLQKQGRTIKEYRDELEPNVRQMIRRDLVVGRISEVNKIEVKSAEIMQAAMQVAQRYQLKRKQAEELLKNRQFVIQTHANILEDKVLNFLLSKVKFVSEGETGDEAASRDVSADEGATTIGERVEEDVSPVDDDSNEKSSDDGIEDNEEGEE